MSNAVPDSADLGDRLSDVDRHLIKLSGNGPDQLGANLDRYRQYLLAIAQQELPSMLGGKLGASDLVQDTLALGYKHFSTFEGTSAEQLACWLRRILINHLQNVVKSYAAEKRDVAREQTVDSRIVQTGEPTPSRALVSREELESFNEALSRLPEESRRVLLLRHRENLSFADIARLLSRSEATARRIWARAVRELQLELQVDESRTS